jgi:hypothetical protein
VLASILFALIAAPLLAGDSVVRVPFVYDDARVFVPVRVDGGPPRWFITVEHQGVLVRRTLHLVRLV